MENDPELQPRIYLASAPYSLRAEDANSVNGIRASRVPEPDVLIPLDNNGKFPASVLPAAQTGNYMKKNEPETSSAMSGW